MSEEETEAEKIGTKRRKKNKTKENWRRKIKMKRRVKGRLEAFEGGKRNRRQRR